MKGIKKWKFYCGLYLGLVLCFLLNFGLAKKSNAIDYEDTGTRSFTSCSIEIGGYTYSGIANNGGCTFLTNTSTSYRTGWANNFTMQLNSALPGKSLVILQGRYNIPGDSYAFTGFAGNSQLSPISSSFTIEQDSTSYDLNFTYVFYTPYPLTSIVLDSPLSLWILNNQTRVDFGKLSYVTLTSEPTRQQITQLQNTLNEINNKSNTTNANLELIRGYLQTIVDDSDRTADAIEEQNERDQEDRDNMESQQSDSQTGAEESSEDLSEGTTTLIGALSNFFTTMSNVSAGNCTLPEITAYGVSLGQLNLCTYSPPAWIQTALSVIVSLIAIRLAYSIFKRIIKIVKSFTGGNG